MSKDFNPSLSMSARDFDRLYETNLNSTPTYKQAYEEAEKVHMQLTGHRRYSDNESFRVSRSRGIRKRK